MNKNMIVLVVLVLAIAGTLIVTQQNEKAAQQKQAQLKAAEEANRLAAEAQQAINEAKRLEQIAKQEAEALKNKIAGQIAQAKSQIDGGQYQQAIDTAKNVLSYDAENSDAKEILELAMAKLKEIAQQQINALTKQEVQKVVKDSDLVPGIPVK
jgi:uncharacterized protein HemX